MTRSGGSADQTGEPGQNSGDLVTEEDQQEGDQANRQQTDERVVHGRASGPMVPGRVSHDQPSTADQGSSAVSAAGRGAGPSVAGTWATRRTSVPSASSS